MYVEHYESAEERIGPNASALQITIGSVMVGGLVEAAGIKGLRAPGQTGKSTPGHLRGLAIRPGGKGEMADISKHHARQPRTTSGEFTTPASTRSDKSQNPRISRPSPLFYLTSLTPFPIQLLSSFALPIYSQINPKSSSNIQNWTSCLCTTTRKPVFIISRQTYRRLIGSPPFPN